MRSGSETIPINAVSNFRSDDPIIKAYAEELGMKETSKGSILLRLAQVPGAPGIDTGNLRCVARSAHYWGT